MVFIAYVLSSLRLLIQAQNQWTNYKNGNPFCLVSSAALIRVVKQRFSLQDVREEPNNGCEGSLRGRRPKGKERGKTSA